MTEVITHKYMLTQIHTFDGVYPFPSANLISYFYTVIHPLEFCWAPIIFKVSMIECPPNPPHSYHTSRWWHISHLGYIKEMWCRNHLSLPSSQEYREQFTCGDVVMLNGNRPSRSWNDIFNYVAAFPPFSCCYPSLQRPNLISIFVSHQTERKGKTIWRGSCLGRGWWAPPQRPPHKQNSCGCSTGETCHCVDYLPKRALSAHLPMH